MLLGIVLFSSDGVAEQCTLFYDGLNPLANYTPYITTTKILEPKEEVEKLTEQLDKLQSMGIDEFIKYALTEEPLSYINVGSKKYNWLDLALTRNATDETVNQLLQIGLYVSPHIIPKLYKRYGFEKTTRIISHMSIDGLENIVIKQKGIPYSITNYFLLHKDFKGIKHLIEKYYLNVNSNIEIGTMVDLKSLTIIDRFNGSLLFDLVEYSDLYQIQVRKLRERSVSEDKFNNEYSIYSLKHNCRSIKDTGRMKVKYVIKRSKIDSLIKELEIDLDTIEKEEMLKLIQKPVIQEYLANKIFLRNIKNSKLKSEPIENFDLLTQDEINNSLKNEEHFYYDKSGLTLKEYLFVNKQYSWEKNTKEMSLERLAFFLIKNNYDFTRIDNINLLKKVSHHKWRGKNLSYYLLRHSTTNKNIKSIYIYLPEPISSYGLNPLEMLSIKSELYNELSDSISEIKLEMKQIYENRL